MKFTITYRIFFPSYSPHRHGNAFREACKERGLSRKQKKKWKRLQLGFVLLDMMVCNMLSYRDFDMLIEHTHLLGYQSSHATPRIGN